MNLEIFCVRDRATDQFGTPMFLVSKGQAIRSFTDEINRQDAQNQMFQHPDDFDLYHLGCFGTGNAQFSVHEPQMICIGKDVKIRS